jgi:hypothetical protein
LPRNSQAQRLALSRQAVTKEERARVEAEFKELGIKLRNTIERSVDGGMLNEEDIATLLDRLSHLVKQIGQGYKTTKEIRKMVDTTLLGYGQVLARRYERKGERKGKLEGKLEDAKNALKEGLSMEQAARITGIPVDKLKKHLAAGSKKRTAAAS